MSHTTWRDKARPIIREVIGREGLGDTRKLRRALRDAYPFGDRQYWPYKVWLDEIKRQMGSKPKKDDPQEELF